LTEDWQSQIRYESSTVVFASPAGTDKRELSSVAERVPRFDNGIVVLFDNGQAKAEIPFFGDILQWLEEDLSALESPPACVRTGADLVNVDTVGIERIVDELRELGPAGVVIALCHAGVTAPAARLACLLERAGTPCSLVCTTQGEPLARFMVAHDVPALPIVLAASVLETTDVQRSEIREQIVAEVERSLTERPSQPLRGADSTAVRIVSDGIDRASLKSASRVGTDLWERLLEARLNDGLPVVVPTEDALDEMLAATGREADEVLLGGPTPRQSPITVGNVVVNSLLAGCLPSYMPTVIAAVEAMAKDEFRFFQAAITSHPSGVAVAVSGPVTESIGMQSGAGSLGPGFRANATIGRAVSMVIMNVAGAIPGLSSLSTFGSPAQYTYCFAELRAGNPWPLYHEEIYGSAISSVTVLKCESPHNVLPSSGADSEELLLSLASALSSPVSNAVRFPADHLVLISPVQAQMLARAGFTKSDVQLFLFEKARVAKGSGGHHGAGAPSAQSHDKVPVVRDPAEFRIFVTGGLGSPVMVAPPWGLSRAVTVPIGETN
jgi:hypothetical protein